MHKFAFAVLTGWLTSSVAQAAPTELAGFPLALHATNFSNGITLADLDGTGALSVVTVVGEGVTVVDGHGATRPGFPLTFHDDAVDQVVLMFQAPPTVCDLDGDGHGEILLAGSNQRLFAVNGAGKMMPGFPFVLDGVVKGPMTCLPAANGKAHDVLALSEQGTLWRVPSSGVKAAKVASVGTGAESGVALLDNAAGATEYIVGGGDASLYRLDGRGAKNTQFTYKMTYRATGVPALADVNDDGQLDIVVGSEDYKIHAVDLSGKPLPGWPVDTAYRLYAGACVGDVDGDGRVDVVAGSGDMKVYALDGRGKPLPGFPARVDARITTGCALADVDRDGRQEIIVTTQTGNLYVIDAHGEALSGFPIHIGKNAEIAPAVGDLDGDGVLDIVAEGRNGDLHVFNVPRADKVPVSVVAWGMIGRDAQHGGRLRLGEGRFRALGLTHPEPFTTDPLHVHYAYTNTDWLAEKETQIRWYLDGKRQGELDNKPEVSADLTQKHQLWKYTLQDGHNFSTFGEQTPLTHLFESPEVEIQNTPPTAPTVALTPVKPSTTQPLQVALAAPSSDADGDALQYHFIWLTDGKVVRQPTDVTTIAPDKTGKHEVWRAMVLAFDGEVEGAPAQAEVEILNTPPGAPLIALSPNAPRTDDTVRVSIAQQAPDDDQDPVHYRYTFWVNDKTIDLPEDMNTVPPRVFHKHDTIRIRATAWDDEVPGGTQDANVTLINTPPLPPKLAIWPPHPKTRDDLVLGVEGQPEDADGDPVTLRHTWTLNGNAVDKPEVVPHADTTRGQTWKLTVVPFDGEHEGQPVSAETVIENTPPSPPMLVLDHYNLFTDEAVAPKVMTPAADDDGDPIRMKYAWTRNGTPVKFAADKATLEPADTKKGEAWSMTATPTDGIADGIPASLSFKIVNAPPGAPALTLSSAEPTVEDAVAVKIEKPAPDKDEDQLTYRYRWLRDGVQVTLPLDHNTLAPRSTKRGEHWRVEVHAFDGEVEGELAVAEFEVRNHVPLPPKVAILPAQPVTSDSLTCKIEQSSTDPDGDSLSYRTRWFKADAPVVLAEDIDTLPSALTFEKQAWRCEVQAFDGREVSVVARSQDVHIGNTAPGAPQVAIEPTVPHTDDDLQCALVRVSDDPDFDPVTYHFSWWLESKPFNDAEKGSPQKVAANKTRRGQNWECMATPNDGKVDGKPSRAAVTIQNSLPLAPKVAVKPDRPQPGSELTCEIETPAHDPDGDPVMYAYQWFKDGVVQDFARESQTVPGRLVVERDIWSCHATPRDDVGVGPTAVSQDVAVLTAPSVLRKRH